MKNSTKSLLWFIGTSIAYGATIAVINNSENKNNSTLAGLNTFEMFHFEFDEQNTQYIMRSIHKRNISIHVEDIIFVFYDKNVITGIGKIEDGEQRYYAVGKNLANQLLTVIFVIRNGVIRPFNVWQTKGLLKSRYEKQ